jgi:hypothetical protein
LAPAFFFHERFDAMTENDKDKGETTNEPAAPAGGQTVEGSDAPPPKQAG